MTEPAVGEPEAVLEVAVAVVEDDERHAPRRRYLRGDLPGQTVQAVQQRIDVRLVGRGVGGVDLGQRGRDRARHGPAVDGIEPDVHVERPVVFVLVGTVVVIVVPVTMVVLPLVPVAVVIVLLEGAALAERLPDQAGGVEQPDHARVLRQRIDRPGERGLHRVADQEDDVRILERRRVGGAHGEGVRRRGAPDDQVRLAHARHHRAHQRMHRLDRGDDPQSVVVGRSRCRDRTAEESRRGE